MEDMQDISALAQSSRISHPSLITHLCAKAGVWIDPGETTLTPPPKYDRASFQKLNKAHTEPEDVHGLGFIMPGPADAPVTDPAEALAADLVEAPVDPPAHHKRRRRAQGEASSSHAPAPEPEPVPAPTGSFDMSDMFDMIKAQCEFQRQQRAWMTELGERQVLYTDHRAEWESVYLANQRPANDSTGSFGYMFPPFPNRLREPFPTLPPFPDFGATATKSPREPATR